MSNHVFVSHSHKDSPAADLMVKALEERDVVCWVAPRDVPAGGSYAEAILDAIESASCFVLIYSERANVSSHVLREVERALKFGVNIVPVRFDDSTPSKSLDYLLATVHWLAIAPEAQDQSVIKAAEQIGAAVSKFLGNRPVAEPDRVPTSRPVTTPVASSPKRRFLWIGAAVALAVVVGGIGFLVSRNSTSNQRARDSTTAASASPKMDEAELPLKVTYRYFAYLSKRDATAAYNLLSADFHRRLPIAKYSYGVEHQARAKLVGATIVSRNERTASAAAVFEDASPDSHQPQWKGPIDLVREPAGWRIDSMKGLWPASGHLVSDSTSGSDGAARPEVSPSAPQSTTAPTSTSPPGPGLQATYGIVQDPEGTAKVREEPFGHSKIVTVLKNGDRVEIDYMRGGWAHILLGPNKGFILKNRLNITPEKQ